MFKQRCVLWQAHGRSVHYIYWSCRS